MIDETFWSSPGSPSGPPPGPLTHQEELVFDPKYNLIGSSVSKQPCSSKPEASVSTFEQISSFTGPKHSTVTGVWVAAAD